MTKPYVPVKLQDKVPSALIKIPGVQAFDLFDEWFITFTQKSKFWEDMIATTEHSPYHREESVAEHTIQALNIVRTIWKLNTSGFSERTLLLAQLSILFHDVAKPECKQEKYTAERGNFNTFYGHESISARRWIDISHELYPNDDFIFENREAVWFLIQEHKSWDYSDYKLACLKATLTKLNIPHTAFYLMKLGDGLGRQNDHLEEYPGTVDFVRYVQSLKEDDIIKSKNVKAPKKC